MELKELSNTLSYLHSELNKIETIVGTLAVTEHEHYRKLTGYDHREISDIAVEEQNASRQLGAVKQMCNSMAQRLMEIQDTYKAKAGGSAGKHEIH